MGFLEDWLYGKPSSPVPTQHRLGSYSMNATTLFGIVDLLDSRRVVAATPDGTGDPGTFIHDDVRGVRLSREELLEKHSYELRAISIVSGASGVTLGLGVSVSDSTGGGWAWQSVRDLLDNTARRLPSRARLAALASTLVPVAALAVLIVALMTGADVLQQFTLAVLSLIAVGGSLLTLYTVTTSTRATLLDRQVIIRPFRWRDLIASRLTVGVGVGAAVLGAAAALGAVVLAQVLGSAPPASPSP